jgi:(p)ppGpp synthase/HD superfamily hydrolase
MYTQKIEQAIQAAAVLHHSHERKGSVPVPYITHLMGVTFLLRDYTADEDTLVAALLHDTLEDTDYTYDELTGDFGETVAEIVQTVTEPAIGAPGGESLLKRKQAYAKQLKAGPLAAVMVAAADKTHNFRSLIETYHDDPSGLARDFSNSHQDRIEAYQIVSNAINNRLKGGIVHEFNHTFELFKQFLLDQETTYHA